MVSLEQIKLLESRITKAIDHVKKVTEENSLLKGKLDSYQKRVDELEVLVQQFKEEQGRIEDGILSALDRLNQFEDAIEQSLSEEKKGGHKTVQRAVKNAPEPAAPPPSPSNDAIEVLPLAEEEDDVSEEAGELDIF
jgi:chromosome segregation ATPase